jgi:hypothetical protein
VKWQYIIPILIIVAIFIRVKIRGFFWRKRDGTKLKFKEFLKQWKKGTMEATPLQMTKISLWAFLPIVAGITWGIVVTIFSGTWWMVLILCGSLPLTFIQILGTYQKYKRLKIIEETMKKVNKKEKIKNVRVK